MESFSEVFKIVKDLIKTQITEVAYNCWISFLEPLKFEDNIAFIYIKTSFQRDVIIKQYKERLENAFSEVLGFPIEVKVLAEEDIENFSEVKIENTNTEKKETDNFDTGYDYTFDTFIVGSSNNFAYAACKAVATNLAGAYNPLFIYGASGLGKTHLLSAIKAEVLKNNAQLNLVSVSSEIFTNELINAIQTKRINEFHNKYRKADILLIDDIQFLANKERTQEEFFHTFNELYQVGKQIVITSDRPPKDIQTLEDRLKSRFEWGLLTDISEPDFETRVAIIRRKADLLKLDLSIDVCEFIANKIKTNIRQLEGTVKKMKANYILLGATPNITSAQSVVKEILSDNKPLPLTIENIIEEVSKTYSVTAEDIRSDKRMASVSNARKVAMYIVREITGLSLSLIGEEFGGRDHSTVIYAINKIEADMKKNDRQRSIIEDLIKNLQTK
ncbi:MAG: chromosomal replication initiator protein DnaA [Oscillospiraceae bacterium]